jgi:hypothetical protein
VIDQALADPGTSGGDIPEALIEDAMRACRDIAKRLGQPICCVVATDAPPHPLVDCPNNIDFRAEVDELLRDGNICILATNWLNFDAASAWKPFEAHPRFFRADIDDKARLFNIMESLGLLAA